MPLLICVFKHEVPEIIHQGVCGNHDGGQSLANKALGQEYFWPLMGNDAQDFAHQCDKCQRFALYIRKPPTEITQMSHWPFTVWGIDIIEVLRIRQGGAKYAMVVVDYFTK